jgi:hypothetical protein
MIWYAEEPNMTMQTGDTGQNGTENEMRQVGESSGHALAKRMRWRRKWNPNSSVT